MFRYLRSFVASQMQYCDARYRFVANGCAADQIALMEQFRAKHPDRVVEILETSAAMVPHGAALDAVLAQRDDGAFFCTVDPDILALGRYLAPFTNALANCAAITSGRGVWRDDDVIPPGHPGVSGEFFYSQDGFLFGSPHFAMYRRQPLEATMQRWNLSFAEGGKGLSASARTRLADAGHDYFIYDTGKLVNIFLQIDGETMCHEEHPNLMHIGGLSHYLSPPSHVVNDGEEEPDWARWRGMSSRFEVARFTAAVLRDLCHDRIPPSVPENLSTEMKHKLQRVREALLATVPRFERSLREVST